MNINNKDLNTLKDYFSSYFNKDCDWINLLEKVLLQYNFDFYKQKKFPFLSNDAFLVLAPFGAYVNTYCQKIANQYNMSISVDFEESFFKSVAKIVYYPLKSIQNRQDTYISVIIDVLSQDVLKSLKSKEEYIKFINSFPMCIRLLSICCYTYINSFEKMVYRLAKDLPLISKKFDIQNLENITIYPLDSDFHGEYTGVFNINFVEKSIVYKSRSIKMFQLFNDVSLIVSPNERFIPNFLDFQTYGYSQFIQNHDLSTKQQYLDYFKRWGKLLAIFFLFSSNDVHKDNMKIFDSTPIIIDVENLIGVLEPQNFNEILRFLNTSAFYENTGSKNSNFGALGLSINDALKFGKISLNEISSNILAGFSIVYNNILLNKSRILKLINSSIYKSVQVRCILRNTRVYDKLMVSFYSNKNLENLSNYLKNLDRLKNAFNISNQNIAECEIDALWCGDVPIFISLFDQKNLYYKDTLINDKYLNYSCVDVISSNINLMNEISLEYAKRSIREIISNMLLHKDTVQSTIKLVDIPQYDYNIENIKSKAEYYVHQICNNIKSMALFSSDNGVFWIMPYKNLELSGFNLFFGSVGISLFLAKYGYIYNDTEALQISNRLLNYVINILKSMDCTQNISFTTGIFGTLYGLLEISKLNNNLDAIQQLTQIANKFAFFPLTNNNDFYNGNAGALYVLSKFNLNDNSLKEFENKANYLYSYDYNNLDNDTFAHGKSGVAFALISIYKRLDNSKYMQRAVEILNNILVPKNETIFGICGGLTGIVYSAISINKKYRSKHINFLVENAIQRCSSKMIDGNLSLCCGQSGMILLSAKLYLDTKKSKYLDMAMKSFLACYNPNIKDISLMHGTSGIGLALLSAISPDKFFLERFDDN